MSLYLKDEDSDEFYFDYHRLLLENKMLYCAGYYLGANNSFVRLFTMTGRKYWVAQASCNYLLPDWKIHFSIQKQHLPQAFNLLSQLYFQMKLPYGLKAAYPDNFKDYENSWPEKMKGREITVYIFQYLTLVENKTTMKYNYDPSTDKVLSSKRVDCSHLVEDNDPYRSYDISIKDEIHLNRYLDFITRAEQLLEINFIETNGCALGDYPIGKYCSIRNEKFVVVNNELKYPPNYCGYNGSNDNDLSQRFNLNVYRKKSMQWNRKIKFFFCKK
ncbi:unnamed protein product [Didymodactylos carnosus]|uniref:Uncharacterized protein n=1 Tax=Didymodactylos carnosus TaxID=1234261 RepID=A0A8S2MZF3_9BILA|nr:unnamed protein product [Didymodactylos carnosus]CAF3977230.1 unnamed protein product [Didymodactylos carnosus]